MATTTMNVSLTPELAKCVQAKVDSGMYSNASEYVRDLIRNGEKSESYIYELKLQQLKAALAPGLEQARKGEGRALTAQDILGQLNA